MNDDIDYGRGWALFKSGEIVTTDYYGTFDNGQFALGYIAAFAEYPCEHKTVKASLVAQGFSSVQARQIVAAGRKAREQADGFVRWPDAI